MPARSLVLLGKVLEVSRHLEWPRPPELVRCGQPSSGGGECERIKGPVATLAVVCGSVRPSGRKRQERVTSCSSSPESPILPFAGERCLKTIADLCV